MKEWEVLSEEEHNYIWNQVIERFKFSQGDKSNEDTSQFLKLPEPFCIYDMHLFKAYLKEKSLIITEEYYNIFNKYITDIMIKCMRNSDFIYALDWQHLCFSSSPIIFVDDENIQQVTREFIASKSSFVTDISILGETGAVVKGYRKRLLGSLSKRL